MSEVDIDPSEYWNEDAAISMGWVNDDENETEDEYYAKRL